jgi:hypothetical protein
MGIFKKALLKTQRSLMICHRYAMIFSFRQSNEIPYQNFLAVFRFSFQ